MYTSILLIGAGGAGWSAAVEFSKRGYNTIILDKHRPGFGSSTRNQGWAHSGSLYLGGIPDFIMADWCRRGFHDLRSNYKNVLQLEKKAYFLYNHAFYAEEHIKRCRELGIDAQLVPVTQIAGREAILRGSRLRYAVEVPDCPFNNAQLLQAMAHNACQLGTRFFPVTSLECITAHWDGTHWHLFTDDTEIICSFIILSCGVFIPEMLKKLYPEQASGLHCMKMPVLVLKADTPIAEAMLLTAHEEPALHLVPFSGSGVSGATICCANLQEPARDYQDVSLPFQWQNTFTNSLQDYVPGIVDLARERNIFANTYICHKLEHEKDFRENRINRQPFCEIYAPEPGATGNVAAIYAGKLTTASLVGKICVEKVEPLLGDLRYNTRVEGTQAPEIAKQPYHHKAPYLLVAQHGQLTFKEINPAP